eukprot:2433193-Pleurochrysis_carterae.AAC.2
MSAAGRRVRACVTFMHDTYVFDQPLLDDLRRAPVSTGRFVCGFVWLRSACLHGACSQVEFIDIMVMRNEAGALGIDIDERNLVRRVADSARPGTSTGGAARETCSRKCAI